LVPFLGLTLFATRRLSQSIDVWQSPGTKRALESSLVLARKSLSKYESDLRAIGPRLEESRRLNGATLAGRAGRWDEVESVLAEELDQLSVDFLQFYEKENENWVLRKEAARRGVSSPGALPQELLRRALESDDVLRSEAGYVALPVIFSRQGARPEKGTAGEPGDLLAAPGYWLGEDFFANVREVTEGRLYYGQLEIYRRVAKQTVWITAAILFAAAALVSLVAAALLARQLSRPILALTDGMKRVAAGQLDEKVTARASGEIKFLVDSFNSMIEDLKFHKEQLARAERIAAWQDVARYAAHEIRNPLTPIKVSIHRLRSRLKHLEEKERERFSDSLESILNEVNSLERLATSFSEFAKLPEPVLALVDVNAIVLELAELYKHADIRFDLALSPKLPIIKVDAQQIRMAFINIIKNAIEAQPQGGVLRIGTALAPRSAGARTRAGLGYRGPGTDAAISPPSYGGEGDFVEVTFTDEGSGIPAALMERVGTPHFTTKKGGTGLGLAVVNKIVSQHGGSLEVESVESKGTTVRITLAVQGAIN
jgi:signal transduction histidine kinase